MISIYIANQYLYTISYEFRRIFLAIGYLVIALFLYYYVDLNLLMRLILIIGMPLLFILLGLFKEDEKVIFRQIRERYLKLW
jgi:hypothetical protein